MLHNLTKFSLRTSPHENLVKKRLTKIVKELRLLPSFVEMPITLPRGQPDDLASRNLKQKHSLEIQATADGGQEKTGNSFLTVSHMMISH